MLKGASCTSVLCILASCLPKNVNVSDDRGVFIGLPNLSFLWCVCVVWGHKHLPIQCGDTEKPTTKKKDKTDLLRSLQYDRTNSARNIMNKCCPFNLHHKHTYETEQLAQKNMTRKKKP